MRRYGWRDVPKYDADGNYVGRDQIPLTLDRILHPEEGDNPVASPRHDLEVRYVADALQALAPDAFVRVDVPHFWGVPGLGHHNPDMAVMFGVRDPRNPTRTSSTARPRGSGRPS